MTKAEAIEHFGSQAKLADVLNISQPAISKWGDEVPPLRAFQIERITKGKLKAGDLQPHTTAA